MKKFRDLAVLVVDDFEPMRKVTVTQLRQLGLEQIMMASNGGEALRLLRRHRVDIILSDWNMPVMTGLELLCEVRNDESLCRLPFVMITAESDRKHLEQAIANGVSDLLVKPYAPDRLEASLERAINWKPRPPKAAQAAKALPPSTTPDGAAAQSAAPEKPTILVVDDTPDNLKLLSDLLKDEYRVRIALNGEKALEICHSATPPDLVLLDVMMPEMDGFEVARHMREHPGSQSIPVIFVTALAQDKDRHAGLELGAIDFVTKPIDPDQLTLRIRNFMRYVTLHRGVQAGYDSMLEAAKLRDDVENVMRHDLRGSLAGVISLIQNLIATDSMKQMNRYQIDQLHTAEEMTLQLLGMINLSSELYKIETGRFRLEAQPIEVEDILQRIVQLARTTFKHKQLTISMATDEVVSAEPARAFGDAMLTWSVLQNLIKNACEAAPEKGMVSIKLQKRDMMCISITNEGMIPIEIRDAFFSKFVTKGKPGGNGIGTYSAKLLTEAQGGQIAFEVSTQTGTTTLSVQLPLIPEGFVEPDAGKRNPRFGQLG